MQTKISIITPAYNAEDYIKECIESVNNQTYKNYEMIIVNDGSKDNTKKIIEEYEKKYDWLSTITIENHGQGYARNLALKQAKGDYILFLDADDFIEPVTLQVCVEKIQSESPDLVVFDWKFYDKTNPKYRYQNKDIFQGKKILQDKDVLLLLKIKHYFSVNKIYSKKFLNDNNIQYGEGYIYEDNPFWVNVVINAKKVSIVYSPLYNVRINENSTTKTSWNTDKHYKGYLKAVEEIIKIINTKPNNDYIDLYEYLIKKFNLYYKKRMPAEYKRSFKSEFVKIMSNSVPPKKTRKSLTAICYKYKVFQDNKVYLFIILGKLAFFNKKVKKILRKQKAKFKKLKKDYNTIEYKKALKANKEKNSILFMGFDYRYTGNSRFLFEEFLKENVENIYFVTDSKEVDEKYKIQPKSQKMYELFYNSKVIIFESWTNKEWIKMDDTKWIQLWHGTPLKKMLFDSDEAEISKVNPKHKVEKFNDIQKWDYLVIDNKNIYRYFETSYLIKRERVLDCGYPRVKYLIENRHNEQLKKDIKRKAGIPEDKKVILYLPTWRDYNYGRSENEIDYSYFPDMDKIKNVVGDDYVIISKNHVFLNNKNKDSITNVTTETQELLLIGDYLISDYSSVIFDAFAIDLPVVLLANDFEKYQKSRGVYESIWKDLLPFVSYTEEELGKAILNYNINTQEYKNVKEKFSYLNNGEDLVNFILNI